ncbi:MAG: hypothetical protein RLY87_2105 [Chloroflexota bacterium]|jgi:hypothetical protein
MTIRVATQRTILFVVLCMAASLWVAGGLARWGVVFGCCAIVPGWWVQEWTGSRVPLVVRAWAGFAIIAVSYLWAAWLDAAIPVWVWQFMLVSGTGLLLSRWWGRMHDVEVPVPTAIGGVAVGTGILALFASRITQIDGLVLPPWVDAVHHALLVRVAVESGHAPWSLEPYLPVTALTYHSGFHSVMAVLMQLSAIPMRDVAEYLRISGQIWGVCAVLTLVAIVWQWWRSWPVCYGVLVVVGIVSIMPAYYLSWGRYTLLAGMTVLPAALWTLRAMWYPTALRPHWIWVTTVLVLLAVTHMVVFVIALLWGCALVLVYGFPERYVAKPFVVSLIATLPWWLFVAAHTQARAGATAMHLIGNVSHNGVVLGLIWALNNRWLVPALVLGLSLAVWRRSRLGVAVLVWVTLCALVANPPVLGLPYLSFFTNETIAAGLYVPIGLATAWILLLLARRLPEWVLVVVLFAIGIGAYPGIATVVQDTTIIATADDRAVLEWAVDNLPADATVMTNAAGWMWGVDRGADGGWWLLPMAGIAVTTPPVLYTYGAPDDVADIAATTGELRTADGSLAFVERFVAAHREVNYIYASERGAAAKPSVLDTSRQFELRFRSGDVAIYAVIW